MTFSTSMPFVDREHQRFLASCCAYLFVDERATCDANSHADAAAADDVRMVRDHEADRHEAHARREPVGRHRRHRGPLGEVAHDVAEQDRLCHAQPILLRDTVNRTKLHIPPHESSLCIMDEWMINEESRENTRMSSASQESISTRSYLVHSN